MIRLRALGALDLRGQDGQELRAVLAQPRRAALLAYLALATPRGDQRRDTLLALFWPELDTEHARNALSQAVHFLRRSLGAQAIVSRNGDALGLDWTAVWCDAVAFEEALDAGRAAEAIEVYRGDLLEGFHIPGAPEFERWLDAERVRLAGRYTKAVETLAAEREAAGDVDGAVALWRRLAARDLYNSRVTLRLMRALAASGDPAGAVQHARRHEVLLREEMGVAPDAEIAALVRQLQSGKLSDSPRPSSPVPPPSSTEATRDADESGEARQARNAAGNPITARPGAAEGDARRAAADRGDGRGHRRRVAIATGGLVVLFAAAGGAASMLGSHSADAPRIRSIAVLPLEDLSGDSARQAFADGLHDELITELVRYPELTVISRTSVERYKGTKKPLPEIARELHVDAVVEGTVLREGHRVRMNAQLVHGPSDRHLWARSYTRDLRDVLRLQSELAEAIAREVRVASAPAQRRRVVTSGPADSAPEALYLKELFLRGRHAELSRSPVGIQTAREAYRRAIERDSTFALGYAGLAAVYGFIADYAMAPAGPALDSARMMARRAVALDSTLSDTHTALAVSLADGGEFAAAEREFRRAIELGPSSARAHYWYSHLLVALGRGEEALRESGRAAELDPFAPRGLLAVQRYARWLLTGERPHLKLPVAERRPILKLEPGEPWARGRDALEYAQEGQCAEARSAIRVAQQLAPDNIRTLAALVQVYWWCGERARARALVREMKRRPDAREQGYQVAILHTLFGEKDSAFVWLEHQRWTLPRLVVLRADVFLDPLRSDPRFTELLHRLGIQ